MACAGLALTAAAAQPAKPTPPKSPAASPGSGTPPTSTTPVKPGDFVLLADEPFRLDSVGLVMGIPRDAAAQTSQVGDRAVVQITPREGSWKINIQTPKANDEAATPQQAAETLAREIAGSSTISHPADVNQKYSMVEFIDRQPTFSIEGCSTPGTRFYAAIRRDNAPRLVKGYTIFKPGKNQFVIFELVSPETELAAARKAYETCIATARFQDVSALEAGRREAVRAGIELMKRWTPNELAAAMPTGDRWFRIYRPAVSGADADAEELGYFGVKFWKGRRSEVSGQGGVAVVGDNPDGLLCEIKARLYQRQSGGLQVTDSVAVYFQTPDRQQETWTIKTAVRGAGATGGTWIESGARSGSSLSVEVRPPGKPARVINPVVPPEGYITQLETFLLPRLLVRAQQEGDFGFYGYRSETSTVSLRRASLSAPKGASGAWTVATRLREEDTPSRELFNELGEALRAERMGGAVDEPMELGQLVKLLGSKGLPTGAVK